MKVGVTGANGFIGQHIVAALRKRGDEVVAILRNRASLPDAETRIADFKDPRDLEGVLAGLDGVIHTAAHLPKSYADPGEAKACIEINTLGTMALLQACVQSGLARAVVFSSGNVYRPGNVPVAEDGPIDPSAHAPYYLISKAAADFYAQAIARERKVGVAILRPSSVYGPGLARGMVPTFISKLEAGQRVTIQNGGRHRADMVYVEDVASATVSALHSSAIGPFNVGSGTTSSVLEVAEAIARLLGVPMELLDILAPDSTMGASGFSPLDIRLARSSFGYDPREVHAGLAAYVDWWRARR